MLVPDTCTQDVLCEGCRLGSHKQHQYDFVANIAGSERSRMEEVGQRIRVLSSALQGRTDALHARSKKCSESAHGVKQEVKRQFDRVRSALLEREQQLASGVDQLVQVRLIRVHKCVNPHGEKFASPRPMYGLL